MMKMKSILGADEVASIGAAAEAEARAQGWNVTIAVVDDGGHLLWLKRQDGAAAISAFVAAAKAKSAALGRRPSGDYEDMINKGRTAFLSVPEVAGLLEGGMPVMVDGHCIGAIGVSGVKPAQDLQVAMAGLAALALTGA